MSSLFRRILRANRHLDEEQLSAYLDGRLSAPGRVRVERHLATCEACRHELAALRRMVELLRHIPPVRAPRSFVLPRSMAIAQQAHRSWNLTYGVLRGATAVVSLLLVLFVSGDLLLGWGLLSLGERAAKPVALDVHVADGGPAVAERGVPSIEAEAAPAVRAAPAQQSPPPTVVTGAAPSAPSPATLAKAVATQVAPRAQPTAPPPAMVEKALSEPTAAGGHEKLTAAAVLPPARTFGATLAASPTVRLPAAPAPAASVTLVAQVVGGAASTVGPATVAADAAPRVSGGEPAIAPTGGPTGILPAQLSPETAATVLALKAASTATSLAAASLIAQVPQKGLVPTATPRLQALAVPADTRATSPASAFPEMEASWTSGLWALWRTLRVGAAVLLGVLLMLVGGLLWSGYRRRL